MALSSSAPGGRYSGLILRLLRDEGPRSRTKLSDDTGLSPTTISKAVAPLMSRGWLEESGESVPARVGRPAIVLRQRPEAVAVCGIQIGVGVARIGIADAWARVRAAQDVQFDVQAPAAEVLDQVAEHASQLLASFPDCLAVGVAAAGPVDVAQRVNLMSINLGWRDAPVADLLERRLGLPVTVDHNVRSMALAEARYGGHGVESMAYVYVRTGVGLGLVLKGEPFFGGAHGVSELGHIRVRDDGEPCVCGARGCLETVVSEPALTRRLQAAGLSISTGQAPGIMALLEERQDLPAVGAARRELIANLSRGLASVVNLLNPEVIVLGGALADAPDTLVDEIRNALREEVFPLLRDEVQIVRPRLAEAGVSAGAAIALDMAVYRDGE